jgi:2-keto-4-pentenoate hydratase/2-oxohepta-3-ene-1,7-dioic acid hydratase in catechol pathway
MWGGYFAGDSRLDRGVKRVKLVTYETAGRAAAGLVRDEVIYDLSAVAADLISLIEKGSDGLSRIREVVTGGGESLPWSDARLLAPIPVPRRNVMCLGKNYVEHARESDEARGARVEIPELPVIFTKATTSVNGPFADVRLDAAVSEQMDYEAELAIIIGQRAKNVSRDEALACVFGYTVLNDITARDLQSRHKQFFKGKSLDGCCPIGPWIITADEIKDPQTLEITCRVNGELRQESNTREMIFGIADIIVHLSRGMTLLPGDIIATGTPSGVGFARKPPVYLRPGDIVECSVEGVGTIRNRMVNA